MDKKWDTDDLSEFLVSLEGRQKELILIALGRKPKDKNFVFDVTDVKKEIRWKASHWVTYPFRDKTTYDYHDEIMKWTAEEYDVDKDLVESAPTFILEREIMKANFAKMWDKLDNEGRKQLLNTIDTKGKIADKAGIALASGGAAVAALSATVYFTGFAFYATMSTAIAAGAGLLGITLPFAAYATASTTVATLAGPVGWACVGVAALGAVFFLGGSDSSKTAAIICQMHLLKVEALQESGQLDRALAWSKA